MSLGWGLRICISDKLPGYPAAAGPETTFWEALFWTDNSLIWVNDHQRLPHPVSLEVCCAHVPTLQPVGCKWNRCLWNIWNISLKEKEHYFPFQFCLPTGWNAALMVIGFWLWKDRKFPGDNSAPNTIKPFCLSWLWPELLCERNNLLSCSSHCHVGPLMTTT